MKIFYLSTSNFSDNQINLLHHLPKDWSVTYCVVFPSKNFNYTEKELSEYCQQNGINFIPFTLKYRYRDLRVLKNYFKIIATIKKLNPDVVFVANSGQIYLNTILLLLKRSNTIIGIHDVVNHSKTSFNKLINLANEILLRHFNKFLTFSGHQADILRANYQKKKVYTIPLPLIGFGSLPPIEQDKTVLTFLFFGNIVYYKGLDIFLRSIGRIGGKNIKIIIAGRCENWEEEYEPLILNKEIFELHIEFVGNEQIPYFFAKAHYVVLPYRDTSQSGPLMIAYNYNVPVIVSNADGFNEFFEEGITGFRFDLERPEDIDRVLREAIDRSDEEGLTLKQTLATYVNEKFSIEKIVNAYENMFNDIVKIK